ncbi:MAG: hypothetical protein MJZ48_04780, partial [Paludibacteraceae bacterium]|nr:hypothetical protein [Paludibacteraceae bacterium]
MMMTINNPIPHNRTTTFSNISFIVYRREEDEVVAVPRDEVVEEADEREVEVDDTAERDVDVDGVVRVVAEPLLRTRLVTVGLAAVAVAVLREVVVGDVVVVVVLREGVVVDAVLREV